MLFFDLSFSNAELRTVFYVFNSGELLVGVGNIQVVCPYDSVVGNLLSVLRASKTAKIVMSSFGNHFAIALATDFDCTVAHLLWFTWFRN